jgi:hypothetical protein
VGNGKAYSSLIEDGLTIHDLDLRVLDASIVCLEDDLQRELPEE